MRAARRSKPCRTEVKEEATAQIYELPTSPSPPFPSLSPLLTT